MYGMKCLLKRLVVIMLSSVRRGLYRLSTKPFKPFQHRLSYSSSISPSVDSGKYLLSGKIGSGITTAVTIENRISKE